MVFQAALCCIPSHSECTHSSSSKKKKKKKNLSRFTHEVSPAFSKLLKNTPRAHWRCTEIYQKLISWECFGGTDSWWIWFSWIGGTVLWAELLGKLRFHQPVSFRTLGETLTTGVATIASRKEIQCFFQAVSGLHYISIPSENTLQFMITTNFPGSHLAGFPAPCRQLYNTHLEAHCNLSLENLFQNMILMAKAIFFPYEC